MAATVEGQPFLILRIPLGVDRGAGIELDLADGAAHMSIPIKGCDARVCIAYQTLEKRLRTAIEKGAAVGISYILVTDGKPQVVSFRAPFAGLTSALAAI